MPPSTALHTVHGQPSWRIESDRVTAHVTRDGGHLGPVAFRTQAGTILPLSVAPWWDEDLPRGSPDVLRMLRGDFFCAPFGNNTSPWRGERHPPHGEVAGSRWRLRSLSSGASSVLEAEMTTRVRRGRVIKRIELRRSQTNVYSRHELHGFTGPMNLGHHAMVHFPGDEGSGRIALSRIRRGQVLPSIFERPKNRGYSALKPGALFRSLRRVPDAFGGRADLSRYPARTGYEDLVMVSAAAGGRTPLAWTSVTFPGERFVWIAFKDPRVLASTVLWHSNGGRHYAPWSGRHRGVLGLEEVTSYFHYGLAESARPNPVSRAGIPTTVALSARRPLFVNTIMAVVAVPRGFDVVRGVRRVPGGVELRSASGRRARHAVDLSFLWVQPA
jgi:hypothetical protein